MALPAIIAACGGPLMTAMIGGSIVSTIGGLFGQHQANKQSAKSQEEYAKVLKEQAAQSSAMQAACIQGSGMFPQAASAGQFPQGFGRG